MDSGRGPQWVRSRRAADVAVILGVAHSTATVYWACGGKWLLWTLGTRIVETFSNRIWLLWPGALIKLAVAVVPAVLVRRWWPAPRPLRVLMWVSAVVLIVWGGANTVVGNLVLAGLVHPQGGYDRDAMIGHAWLWDPLFLTWGVALAGALWPRRHKEGARSSASRSSTN